MNDAWASMENMWLTTNCLANEKATSYRVLMRCLYPLPVVFAIMAGCGPAPLEKPAEPHQRIATTATADAPVIASSDVDVHERPLSMPSAMPSASAAPAITVEQKAACDAECAKESRQCSAGCERGEAGRGCLRRCGCKHVGCYNACDRVGIADFRCH